MGDSVKRRTLLGRALAAVLAPALLVWAGGCSNDVKLPTAYHQDYLAQPTGVAVEADGAELVVNWQVDSPANIVGFVIRFIDLNGNVLTRFVEGAAVTSHREGGVDLSPGASIEIQLWAVDGLDFYGPRSAVSQLVIPES